MNRAFAAVLLAAAFVTPSLAHADYTDFVVSTTAGGIASAATFTAIDVVADPSSKLYGVTEAVVNGAFVVTGAINLATMEGDRVDGARAVVAGVALWNQPRWCRPGRLRFVLTSCVSTRPARRGSSRVRGFDLCARGIRSPRV